MNANSTNEKLFFQHLVKTKNFIPKSYIFKNNDIKVIYEYIQEYYNEYKIIPDPSIINFDDKKILKLLFDYSVYDNTSIEYILDNINKHIKEANAERKLLELIDLKREGNYDKLFSELSDKFEDIKEDFSYENKTTEQISKFNKMLSSAKIDEVNKYLDNKLDLNVKYKVNKYLLYPILKENQLAMFFGSTGDGKTVLAVEFANIIAKGKCDWNNWYCECPSQNVCYIDFELGSSSFSGRYKNGKFSPNLHIINVNVNEYNNYIGWSNNQSVRIDRAINYIVKKSEDTNSKIIFVDNFSNIADQVEQAKEADRFISDLYGRMKTLGLTIVFLGHTPKIPKEAKLSINQLKGSSSLSKTFESIVGFKRSEYKNISYVKQLKHRDLDLIFDDENVGKFEFNKDGKFGFEMNFIGTDDENDMLNKNYKNNSQNASKYSNEIICDVLFDKNNNKNNTWEALSIKYNIPIRSIKKFKEDYELNKNDLKEYYKEYVNRQDNKLF